MTSQVKWIGKDGGWKIGEVVELPRVYPPLNRLQPSRVVEYCGIDNEVLVKLAYTGELEFVAQSRMFPYPHRSKRGEEPYGSDTVKSEPVDYVENKDMKNYDHSGH